MYKQIDLDKWNRKSDYEFFTDNPSTIYMSADIDVTDFMAYAKSKELRPYICILYAVSRCINAISGFRMSYAKENDKTIPVIYDMVKPNYPVLNDDKHPINKQAEYVDDFSTFYEDVNKGIDEARIQKDNTFQTKDNFFLTSYVPYPFSSTFMVTSQTVKPCVIWGKCKMAGERHMLPVTISFTHAFIDGQDFVDFFTKLEECMNQPEKVFDK